MKIVFDFPLNSNQVNRYDLRVATFNPDDNDYTQNFISLPSSPPPQKKKPTQQQSCVATRNELQEAVNNCDETNSGMLCALTYVEENCEWKAAVTVVSIFPIKTLF